MLQGLSLIGLEYYIQSDLFIPINTSLMFWLSIFKTSNPKFIRKNVLLNTNLDPTGKGKVTTRRLL